MNRRRDLPTAAPTTNWQLATGNWQLAEVIWRKIRGPDTPPRVTTDTPFEHEAQKRVSDVSRARDVLGLAANTSLEDMLDEVTHGISLAVDKRDLWPTSAFSGQHAELGTWDLASVRNFGYSAQSTS